MDINIRLLIVTLALSFAIVQILFMIKDIRKRLDDLEDDL